MTEANLEKLGQLKDKVDNITASLNLPMPPAFHIEQFKKILPEISEEIKSIYLAEGGEDVWD